MSDEAVAATPAATPAAGAADDGPRLRPGWIVVAGKELADHVTSVRFKILLGLLGLVAVATVYSAASTIQSVAPQASGSPALFLRLFTVAPERVPAFFTLVAFLAPLLGIAFGFDAVSGERAQGTLPRLLAQPIHRDDVINGKFAGGLAAIAAMLVALTLVVAGIGLLRLGLVPSGGEVVRIVAWLLVLVVYVGFWLGLATLFSVTLRRAATAALACIAAWLVFTLFFGLLVGLVTDAIAPVPDNATVNELITNARISQAVSRLSPATLYSEATIALLNPDVRSVGLILPQQLDRAIPSTLPVEQSLIVVWPQVVGLFALTIVLFALAYVAFMRQEIRA